VRGHIACFSGWSSAALLALVLSVVAHGCSLLPVARRVGIAPRGDWSVCPVGRKRDHTRRTRPWLPPRAAGARAFGSVTGHAEGEAGPPESGAECAGHRVVPCRRLRSGRVTSRTTEDVRRAKGQWFESPANCLQRLTEFTAFEALPPRPAPPVPNGCPATQTHQPTVRMKRTCSCRPFRERLMGFEPTTFCMASRT
jgi:hypothetical protein